jgi:hypothetical protein
MNGVRFSIVLGVFLASAALATADSIISWDVNAEVSGVTDATFKRSSNIGDVSSFDTQFHAIASAQVKPEFLLRLGFEFQRYDFDLPARAPLPNNLESLGVLVGGDFQFGDAWLFRLDLHPGYYSANGQIDGDDFNLPITLGGSFFIGADLQFVAGVGIDLNRKYPVLPAAGLRWKFAREWVLNAILPRPRLEYLLGEKSVLYVGGDFRLGTYRVDDSFGESHGLRRLDNAVVDYTQIRVGAGVSSKIASYLTLEFEAGCVPLDEFDFHRADIGVRSQDVPFYARIGLQAQF